MLEGHQADKPLTYFPWFGHNEWVAVVMSIRVEEAFSRLNSGGVFNMRRDVTVCNGKGLQGNREKMLGMVSEYSLM